MKKMLLTFTFIATSAITANTVFAQDSHAGHHSTNGTQATQKAQIYTTRGTVEGIDKTAKKLTLWHEPIAALKWPAMTMNFAVEDVSLLEGLKIKDKIRFDIRTDGNTSVVVDIEVIK